MDLDNEFNFNPVTGTWDSNSQNQNSSWGPVVVQKKQIRLMKDQIPHVATMIDMLINGWYIVRDTSGTGKGKSICAMDISNRSNLPIFLVAPPQVLKSWSEKYGDFHLNVTPIGSISYEKLRGNKTDTNKDIYLDYLIRYNKETPIKRDPITGELKKTRKKLSPNNPGYVISTTYRPKSNLTHIIRQGTLFVFDEVHYFKNKNITSDAVYAIVSEIERVRVQEGILNSRVMFVSATPIDKPEQAVNLMRNLQIIKAKKPYATGAYYAEGYIQEILKFAYKNVATRDNLMELLERYSYDATPESDWEKIDQIKPISQGEHSYKNLIFDVFIECILPGMTSTMPSSDKNVFRGFFNLNFDGTTTNSDLYASAVTSIQQQLALAAQRGSNKREIFRIITLALQNMERACIDAMCRFFHIRLKTNKWCKVLGSFAYKENLWKFLAYFKQFPEYGKPVEISGKISPDERVQARRSFVGGWFNDADEQESVHSPGKEKKKSAGSQYKDPDAVRVMGMTTAAGGTGIDLNDRKVNGQSRPVILGITPTYSLIQLHQAAGRVQRIFTEKIIDENGNEVEIQSISACEVYMFYGIGKDGAIATGILNSLYKKAETVRKSIIDTHTAEGRENRIFPGEYPRFIEGIGYIDENAYKVEDEEGNLVPLNTSQLFQIPFENIQTTSGPMSKQIIETLKGFDPDKPFIEVPEDYGGYFDNTVNVNSWGSSPLPSPTPPAQVNFQSSPLQSPTPGFQANPWAAAPNPWNQQPPAGGVPTPFTQANAPSPNPWGQPAQQQQQQNPFSGFRDVKF